MSLGLERRVVNQGIPPKTQRECARQAARQAGRGHNL
jgi:hypothetical protein